MANTALDTYRGRVDEDFLIQQVEYHYENETHRDRIRRIEDADKLYRGDLDRLFPDENDLPDINMVENKFKNALHDSSRLSTEGRGAVKSVPRGDKDKDNKAANVREAINEGYWIVNKMRRQERRLFMDIAGAGMMAVSIYYDDKSPYPQFHRLDPRFLYPDVRNGRLQTLIKIENVKERIVGREFPHLGLNIRADNQTECLFVCYYDETEVCEAILFSGAKKNSYDRAVIAKRWPHELDCIPVGFEALDTFDGAIRGGFDQLAGPLMVRNKLIRYAVDYAAQTSHAPLFADQIANADDPPGPDLIYRPEPNAENPQISRVPPAQASQDVWRLLSYMGDQEEREAIQPPSRSGDVSQSIASGSFVDRTQGTLTSWVKELQDDMASLREQLNECSNKLEEKHMNFRKPLIRPVAGKKTYVPSEDIDGWYFHEVKYGAGAGLDRLNTDQRVTNHVLAGFISREDGRGEIDYIDDVMSIQEKIDKETISTAILQRFIADPTTPMPALVETFIQMTDGKSLVDALKETLPALQQAQQAQLPQQPGLPAAPEGAPPEGATGGILPTEVPLGKPPLAQLFGRVG